MRLKALESLRVRDQAGYNAADTVHTANIATNTANIGALQTATAVTAWTAVTFQNSWVNYNTATHNAVEYRKVGDLVAVRGSMKNGTNNNPCFTLPVGFRPPNGIPFKVANSNGVTIVIADCYIGADGVVVIYATSTVEVGFSLQFSVTA